MVFQGQQTHIWANLKDKRKKQRIKGYSYMEPTWSNIAMQRTVNDHTSYMIRARTKCEMDGKMPEHWSASKPQRLYELLHNTRMLGITRDRQDCQHLPPTPQPWGTVISKGSRAPEHHVRVQRNYPYPPRTLTLRINKQEYGQIRSNDEPPPHS